MSEMDFEDIEFEEDGFSQVSGGLEDDAGEVYDAFDDVLAGKLPSNAKVIHYVCVCER